MLGITIKDIEIKKSNCNDKCEICNTNNLFYSVLNGNFVYYCHTCKKWVKE
jgi:hypothetical protein